MRDPSGLLDRIRSIRVSQSGERRAPHKPLLLLVAIGNLLAGRRTLPYPFVEQALRPLLDAYAPPVKGRHEPKLPYWHLQSDGLWSVDGAATMPTTRSGFPTLDALRASSARLPDAVADALLADRELRWAVIRALLDDHFPASLHEDLLDAVGITDSDLAPMLVADGPAGGRRARDPVFRQQTLVAYEHRCAVTGYFAALEHRYFGVDAAHVRWHAYGGPDRVDNGLALEPTLHKLFDAGAWSLTDDHRVLVSVHLTGADGAVSALRALHGRRLRRPLAGFSPVSTAYIRWHREPDLGGVFRGPAMPLG